MTDRSGNRIAGNAAALLAARLVAVVAVLVTTPVLFSLLGPTGFGVWALLTGTFAVAGLADLGLASAQVREAARAVATGDDRRARAAFAIALLFSGGFGCLLAAGILGAWPAFATIFHLGDLAADARGAALVLAAGFLVESFATPWRAALEGTQRMRPVALAGAASAVAGGALGVAFAAGGGGLVGVAAGSAVGSVLRAGVLVASSRRSAAAMAPSFRAVRREDVRAVLGYGLRVQGTNASFAVNVDGDRLFLGVFFSPSVVAAFDLGGRLAAALRVLPCYAIMALFPAAAALHANGDRSSLDELYARATRYLTLFAALAAAALMAAAEPLVTLWIGQQIPLAADALLLLVPAYVCQLAAGAATAVTCAEGNPGLETRYALLAAAVNAVLTVPLLVVAGPIGVPLATAIGLALGTSAFLHRFHRVTGRPLQPVLGMLWKPFTAAAIAVLALRSGLGLDPPGAGRLAAAEAIASRAVLALAIAVVALWAFRFFDSRDRALTLGLIRRVCSRAAPLAPLASRGGRSW